MMRCTLDHDDCIDLLTVLRIVNQINQEQAWATCYELASLMQRLSPANCAPIESLAQIYLHKDGTIHEKSVKVYLPTQNRNQEGLTETSNCHIQQQFPSADVQVTKLNQQPNFPPTKIASTTPPTPPITPELNELLRRRPALNEAELVASLGIALFWALDHGIPDDEERKLSDTMECLIVQSQTKLSLDEIINVCLNRLGNGADKLQASVHYKNITRTLLNDTIELSIFLEKIYTASMVLSDIALDDCLGDGHHNVCDIGDTDLSQLKEPFASLRALRINDWARLWMQVVRELRQRDNFKQQALSVN